VVNTDTVAFVNGVIYTGFSPPRRVRGLAVVNGIVVYAGDPARAAGIVKGLGGDIVDLGGKVAIPGFVDAHLHLDSLGMSLRSADLRGVRSIAELRERIRRFLEQHPDTEVVFGRGWDQELFKEGRWPTRWDIDDVTGDRPAVLVRVCGHAALLNTRALVESGLIDVKSPLIMRREDGEPTGVVKEEFVQRAIEALGARRGLVKALEEGARYVAAHGVTEVGFVSCNLDSLNAVMELWRRGKLPIRVRLYLEPEAFRRCSSCLAPGFGDGLLRVTGLKVIVDGSLGARTAWLSEPYADDPSTRGSLLWSYEELKEVAMLAFERGFQLAIHAIGDATLDIVLRLYRELGVSQGDRARVEHASVARPEQIAEMAKIGAVAVVQPHFVITDWWVVRRVGKGRVTWVYPFRTMVRRGVRLALSTDAPVEPVDPFETLYAAVTRGINEGIELGRITPNETLEVHEALDAYTRGSAYALRDPMAGSLEPGHYADLVVLSADPLATEPTKLRDIEVVETYVGGRRVYP